MCDDIFLLSKSKQILLEIYRDLENTDKFSVGYIIDYNDNEVLLALIDPTGNYDGYCVYRSEDIFKVSKDTKYINMFNIIDGRIDKSNIKILNNNLIYTLLQYAKRNKYIVSIEIENSGYMDTIGYVTNVDNNISQIQNINEYGEPDGIDFISISSISCINCDSIGNQFRDKLYKYHKL